MAVRKVGICGFTLAELVIIVAILGLLGAVIVPRHVDMQRDAELAAAQRFGAALEEGRTFYVARAATTGMTAGNMYFDTFVAHPPPGNPQHTVELERALINLMADPGTAVWSDSDNYTTITLTFQVGAQAIYTIDPPTAEITDVYIGFSGGGGCE
jgi:type II secretory pathway pseudopilin PulG